MVAVAKVTFEDPSRVARGSVLVWVDGQPVTLTEKGWALLLSIGKGRYVRGAEVATTRKLVDGCLVRLRERAMASDTRVRVMLPKLEVESAAREERHGVMGTKNKPGHYDCYANAHPDEPMFVLLGRDVDAPALLF